MAGDAAQLRRGIGYVIQQAGLFPHRTILDNIATVPLLLGWNKAQGAQARAAELMETVGLAPEMAKRYPTQLSGGQQQRVGVARALAADPPILLMDEPFSAVDPVVRESLQDELLRLQGELGKTIVFVTHDIDEAVKLGDKVAVLRVGGKLAQYDEPGTCSPARPTTSSTTSSGRDRGYRGLRLPVLGRAHRWASCPRSRSARSAARRRGLGARRRRRAAARRAGSTRPSPRPGTAGRRTSTSCPAARCTTWGPARCAARSTPRCPRRPGSGWRSTSRARSSGRSAPTTCCAVLDDARRDERGLRSAHDLGARQSRHSSGSCCCSTSASPCHRSCIGLVLAIPLGWLANRNTVLRSTLLNVSGLLYTVPSLALFVLLPPLLGTGILNPANVIVALTIYTVALLVRTVADGLAAVPSAVVNSATAMGYTPAAPVHQRRAADGRSGDPRRAPGGGGVGDQPGHGRCGDRLRRPRQDVHRRLPARHPGRDRSRASSSCCCSRWPSTG